MLGLLPAPPPQVWPSLPPLPPVSWASCGLGGQMPEGCPSVASVCEGRMGVKIHLPKGARQLWLRHNDERAWADLLALPKMVLRARNRGGMGHKKRIEAEKKKRRCQLLRGHRGSLWQPDDRSKQTSGQPSASWDEARRHDRVTELLREGLLQHGCSALMQAALSSSRPKCSARCYPSTRGPAKGRRSVFLSCALSRPLRLRRWTPRRSPKL